jgi:RraA family protein
MPGDKVFSAGSAHEPIVEAFRALPTSILSDNLSRMSAIVGLRPFHRGGKLVGNALTVRVRAGDNLVVHQALSLIKPGDVLVVDGGGDTTRALVGEIMKSIAQSKGAVGFVIDGAIRDVAVFAASGFPCYARAAVPRGPSKTGPGEINVPVTIGGWVVSPRDIVIGDEDGLVTFPPAIAPALLAAARAQVAQEAEILRSIREGRYDGRLARPTPPVTVTPPPPSSAPRSGSQPTDPK